MAEYPPVLSKSKRIKTIKAKPRAVNHLLSEHGHAGIYPDAPAISKTIETTKGESYTLSLQYAGRPGFGKNVNRFEVLIDGSVRETGVRTMLHYCR